MFECVHTDVIMSVSLCMNTQARVKVYLCVYMYEHKSVTVLASGG